MLETVKYEVNKRTRKSFNEKYIDYLLLIRDINIMDEFKFIKQHNKLDILKLDIWISKIFEEGIR